MYMPSARPTNSAKSLFGSFSGAQQVAMGKFSTTAQSKLFHEVKRLRKTSSISS
jgi:hypothetical protein